ncbi:hypothetical protein D9615_001662 [Tricholomella constricta]|uniref:DUF6589 domain-containing protein n=1 Tax=Tricholomella constricta TaxID=117010 RepID=A0A8H5HPH9_9AGAR|nr:hypothetical protein D9615_001662 [Tricholomella constricta]
MPVAQPYSAPSTNPRTLDSTSSAHIDEILCLIKRHGWTIGDFLQLLFDNHPGTLSQTRIQMVAAFLNGTTSVRAHHIVEMMHSHRFSAPVTARNSPNRSAEAAQATRRAKELRARYCLDQWAIEKVENQLDKEADSVSSEEFHVANDEASWDFILNFSMQNVLVTFEKKGPTILRLLISTAIPRSIRQSLSSIPYAEHLGTTPPSGKGQNRRNPLIIVLVAYLMLMNARNLQFTAFQKIVGVWLFAHTSPHGVYSILNRIGLSTAYSTVLELLKALSTSALTIIREEAQHRAFLLIYDNINRMARAWTPDLGQRDTILNGTAATFVLLEDCDVELAFDVDKLRKAQEEERRKGLNLEVLYKRIDWNKFNAIMALHCLDFLLEEVPELAHHRDFVKLRFRTTMAVHRMRRGRKTTIHPLATSDFNEGNTAENAKVLYDLLVNQLNMPKEEVEKLLVIVGGDQSTVEKLRTLKKFLASCPHGYTQYGWVLPLIQLWHMGWADLERIINTHWGSTQTDDLSSFCSTNVLLGRKVKDIKRPDYYPAQHLVYDVLRADILDCWKTHLKTSNLSEYFREDANKDMPIEVLLEISGQIQHRYMTTEGYSRALAGGDLAESFFNIGDPWNTASVGPGHSGIERKEDKFEGDQVLANTILRMRDSVLHYEFQCAIADGDIGRALNVMSFWTFTFPGAGKSKYSNELLELACNFEFEYCEALQTAVKNNWLCNLSGIEGCWFPMDLLQEKNIKQLKKMSQHRDMTFGGKFFREVISINIRHYLNAISAMNRSVKISAKGGVHRQRKRAAALKELTRNMEDQGLHKFCAGRHRGHAARDDFEVGYLKFSDGKKIQEFIERTLRDAGAIHSDDGNRANDGNGNEGEGRDGHDEGDEAARFVPSMMVDGRLVLGDVVGDSDTDSESDSDTE